MKKNFPMRHPYTYYVITSFSVFCACSQSPITLLVTLFYEYKNGFSLTTTLLFLTFEKKLWNSFVLIIVNRSLIHTPILFTFAISRESKKTETIYSLSNNRRDSIPQIMCSFSPKTPYSFYFCVDLYNYIDTHTPKGHSIKESYHLHSYVSISLKALPLYPISLTRVPTCVLTVVKYRRRISRFTYEWKETYFRIENYIKCRRV